MAKHLISDAQLRVLKEHNAPARMSDGEVLYLLPFVKGNFAPAWRFDYSFGGKRRTLSLGTLAKVKPKAARERADEFRQLVAGGTDPSAARKDAKAEQRAIAAKTQG